MTSPKDDKDRAWEPAPPNECEYCGTCLPPRWQCGQQIARKDNGGNGPLTRQTVQLLACEGSCGCSYRLWPHCTCPVPVGSTVVDQAQVGYLAAANSHGACQVDVFDLPGSPPAAPERTWVWMKVLRHTGQCAGMLWPLSGCAVPDDWEVAGMVPMEIEIDHDRCRARFVADGAGGGAGEDGGDGGDEVNSD